MTWSRRGRHPLPLQLPRLDGTSWPDRREVGRVSFAASTLYQLGYREAFEPEAHDITDLLLDLVMPMLPAEAAPAHLAIPRRPGARTARCRTAPTPTCCSSTSADRTPTS